MMGKDNAARRTSAEAYASSARFTRYRYIKTSVGVVI
jgi:hypothetical protein